jgi:hypothetical protein
MWVDLFDGVEVRHRVVEVDVGVIEERFGWHGRVPVGVGSGTSPKISQTLIRL